MSLSHERSVKQKAKALGFDVCGIAGLWSDPEQEARFAEFIAAGWHGDMDWLASTADRRREPRALWPEARSAVMLGMNYGSNLDPFERLKTKSSANISIYALGRDYHDVIKGRLKELASHLAAITAADVKVFVDTAPLMEKPLARKAGIGWQGKHTNLVSREEGSWLFLGAILTTATLVPDEAERDHCGSCRACLDICPTKAFPAPYKLDPRRCISYLTIEHKGHIDLEFRQAMGNRIYGCDDCLAVCPWNKFARVSREAKLAARTDLIAPPLAEFLALDEEAFRRKFAGSPVKRTGRDRFLRNVLIATANAGDPNLIPRIEPLLGDRSPLVRAMAVWALSKLATPHLFSTIKEAHLAGEVDAAVRQEWTKVLSPNSLFCLGMGYCARALARRLKDQGWRISGTVRDEAARVALDKEGFAAFSFDDRKAVTSALEAHGNLLLSIPPSESGDPVLGLYRDALTKAAASFRWIAYLSTTGVYGDRRGGWVDETSELLPTTERGKNRLAAEQAWLALHRTHHLPIHIFRLAGIYGPGRNQLLALRKGEARRIVKPKQVFSRIHVDDVAGVLQASIERPHPGRCYNVCDDEPAPPEAVIAYAAEILGLPAPPEIPYEHARLSGRSKSFYEESKRVSNQRIKNELGYRLLYPSFREGLRALKDSP